MNASWTVRAAAVLGFLGVALGAFGAHGLELRLEANDTVAIWETATLYQLVHAVALLAVALVGRADRWLAGLWIGGVVVFSGSLYVLAFTGITWLGAITPIGGVALIAGWLVMVMRGR